jgi:hypothetical protein
MSQPPIQLPFDRPKKKYDWFMDVLLSETRVCSLAAIAGNNIAVSRACPTGYLSLWKKGKEKKEAHLFEVC